MNKIYFHQNIVEPEFSEVDIQIKQSFEEENIAQVHAFNINRFEEYFPLNYTPPYPEVLLIPVIYDRTNSTNYDGVEFALQWYFFLMHLDKKFAVVLLGAEDKASFLMHSDYALFLKCPNVHYVRFRLENLKKHIPAILPTHASKKEYIDAVRKLDIKPPLSYKSHHSVTNEWSILRWSKYLAINCEELEKLQKDISTSLYYAWLHAIYPISEIQKSNNKHINAGKILLIDDEADKGWNFFFKNLFLKNHYRSIGENFKKKKVDEIVEDAIQTVEEFKPDLVILDLRLHDDDFDQTDPEGLSGVKILQKIKNYNPGIQVLGFSASDKIWNYLALEKYNIDGYILKEAPEMSLSAEFTQQAIYKLIKSINFALQKKYLSDIYRRKEDMKGRMSHTKLNQKFIDEIHKQIDISYYLLYQADSGEEYAYAFVSLYLVVECINNYFIKSIDEIWHIRGIGGLYDWIWDKNVRCIKILARLFQVTSLLNGKKSQVSFSKNGN